MLENGADLRATRPRVDHHDGIYSGGDPKNAEQATEIFAKEQIDKLQVAGAPFTEWFGKALGIGSFGGSRIAHGLRMISPTGRHPIYSRTICRASLSSLIPTKLECRR
jgi:hypothetical protein